MNLPALEQITIVSLSMIATTVCVALLAKVARRRDLPAPLQRIEIAWTAVSLGMLLAALAATSF